MDVLSQPATPPSKAPPRYTAFSIPREALNAKQLEQQPVADDFEDSKPALPPVKPLIDASAKPWAFKVTMGLRVRVVMWVR